MSVVIEGIREDSLRRCNCRFVGNWTTCFAFIVVELEAVGSERAASLGHLAPYQFYNSNHFLLCCVQVHILQCVCFSSAPVSPSKTTCLLPSPAGGVDEEVVGFPSHLKEVKQLRKVVMAMCENLSPSLIATICEGLCSSNSVEEVIVTSEVSVLFVCLTTPLHIQTTFFCK